VLEFYDSVRTPVMTKVFKLTEKGKGAEAITLMKTAEIPEPDAQFQEVELFIEAMQRHAARKQATHVK
jgi:hypothetical protein